MTNATYFPGHHAKLAIFARYGLLSFILLTTSILALIAR